MGGGAVGDGGAGRGRDNGWGGVDLPDGDAAGRFGLLVLSSVLEFDEAHGDWLLRTRVERCVKGVCSGVKPFDRIGIGYRGGLLTLSHRRQLDIYT